MSSMPMHEPLPKFDKPPVAETVIGVQFERLAKFRTAHAGCFWKDHLGDEWPTIEETVRIDDQFERFGDERKWGSLLGFRVMPVETQRTQISRADNARMIQIQDSRFVYNWKKTEGPGYPTFETT